ncbi:MAG: glycoside hydrolase family 65 protein [Candidatus Omnitrophota bacterium]|nr:MAG: glycoside hydrolase family 65 protein [Candidatus Omnitrophota bacterium]
MKELYSAYTDDELWLIKETEWNRDIQNIRGSQFALGNGCLGTRGICEEIPYDAVQGTFIAGVYDRVSSKVSELVNLPNPVNFHLTLEGGEKVGVINMDVIDHRRALNMKRGVLVRHTLFQDAQKRRYNYQSLRLLSMHEKNIGAIQIVFKPLDSDCEVDVYTGIDIAIYNTGGISEGRKRHFRVKGLGQEHDAGYLIVDTLEKKHTIAYWSGFYYEINGKTTYAKDNIFRLKLEKDQTVTFTKIFCIKHFPYEEGAHHCKRHAYEVFNKAFHESFPSLLKKHIQAWERLWEKADVAVGGTANIQQNVRFNIYHMLACGHYDNGFSSIGARTLSGEGYRGHIFWDSEIFLMPFYLFTFPELAKNMLLYRYQRLDAARKLAKEEGYQGAKFAWESGDTGEEETPEWARDIDRTIVRIHTHKWEHHLTADIAYAVYKYYVVTKDKEFMADYGFEILFETARFWASRVHCNRKRKKCEINNVIGPDEFHINVNNNAFTNIMAKWNLITAHKMYRVLKQQKALCKSLRDKLNLTEEEVRAWKEISYGITMNTNRKGVIEQFDGYFKLREVSLRRTDENGIPLIPSRIKAKDLGKTKLVKQADVLMFLVMLDDIFSRKTKEVNYEYYMPRTVHRSSLSAPIHSLIACEVGDINKAYSLFNVGLRADISNLYGNTYEGIHAASLGGVWQAVIFGFAGVKVKKEELHINPRMPRTWSCIDFSLTWREDTIGFNASNNVVKLKIDSKKKKQVKIYVFGKAHLYKTNKQYTIKRPIPKKKEEYY